MEILSRFPLILFFLVGSLVLVQTETVEKSRIQASTCPQNSTISPCTCTKDSWGIRIECSGSAVDQRSVEKLVSELGRVNEIPEDLGFSIDEFNLAGTKLTQLDLTPFCGNQINHLLFNDNSKLTKLVTSGAGNPQGQYQFIGSIHVGTFYLFYNPITSTGFGDALKYFSNEMTSFSAWGLDLSNHHDNNDSDKLGFFAGLSALTNLTVLSLDKCRISGRLNSSHFKSFSRLEEISLSFNKIDGIGSDVFPSGALKLRIDLEENKLDENSFHPNSGIARAGRKTQLSLQHNQMKTLPSQIFQTFLQAHPHNKFGLTGNPLICNEKLGWLKSGRKEFGSRVDRADCSNDRGHTVFDSNLIH